MITKSLCRAFVFVSLLSFAISFPSDHVSIAKSQSQLQRKEKVDSISPFRTTANTETSPFQHAFLPDVFVLSLSSTSGTTGNTKRKRTRKSNKITVQAIGEEEEEKEQLPLRTIEYRRRKHEWAERYTSQEGLREAFGSNRNKWWGDLDAQTARRLYKKLLFPTALSELVLELGDEIIRPEELAPLAYEARKAAKMYARERSRIPSRVGAYLFDGFRQLRKYGRFQPNGASYEQLWVRYYEENGNYNVTAEEEWDYLFGPNNKNDRVDDNDNDGDNDDILEGVDDAVTEEEIVKRTCQQIFEKSRTTNEAIDRFYLEEDEINAKLNENDDHESTKNNHIAEYEDKSTGGKTARGKRWRSRKKKRTDHYNDLLLERITKTLERDVRKLLEPSNDIADVDSLTKEENLSSRRMTPQEYHSLKLFAKARKHSQQQQQQQHHAKEID